MVLVDGVKDKIVNKKVILSRMTLIGFSHKCIGAKINTLADVRIMCPTFCWAHDSSD